MPTEPRPHEALYARAMKELSYCHAWRLLKEAYAALEAECQRLRDAEAGKLKGEEPAPRRFE